MQYDCVPVQHIYKGEDEYGATDENCDAADYDSVTAVGTPWPGTKLSHAPNGNLKGGSVTLASTKPCTYTSHLVLHGTHNYSREVESMPLYRDFNYNGTLKEISCFALMCRVTVPLLKQFGWIYSDKAHTTCVKPIDAM